MNVTYGKLFNLVCIKYLAVSGWEGKCGEVWEEERGVRGEGKKG